MDNDIKNLIIYLVCNGMDFKKLTRKKLCDVDMMIPKRIGFEDWMSEFNKKQCYFFSHCTRHI